MKPNFFKSKNRQLLAMYYDARGTKSKVNRSVVICSPIGQEYVRSHWCLRLLAGQLARRGMNVLRFDYSGIGDSTGSIDEISSLNEWKNDIESAIRFQMEFSQSDSVMLLGLRAGASLATHVARESEYVNSLLLWEPVHSGANHLDQLRSLHRQMLDLWICRMETENGNIAEEILGSRYRRSLINELDSFHIDWNQIEQPHFVLDNRWQQSSYELDANPMRKIEFTDDENSWNDLKMLETAWMRPESTRRLVDQAVDTFNRLENCGVLGERHLV